MTSEIYLTSIEGVMREIKKRDDKVRQIRYWYRHPDISGTQFTMGYLLKEGPKLLRELNKLKAIKAELIYLYELSKLQAA